MSFQYISNSEILQGAVLDNNLLSKIKYNFDNLKPALSLAVAPATTVSIGWADANIFNIDLVTLTPAMAISFSGLIDGETKVVMVHNTSAVAKTVTFPGAKWSNAVPITNIAALKVTAFTFVSSRNILYCTATENLG